MKLAHVVSLLIAAVAIGACGSSSSPEVIERPGEPTVANVSGSDAEMNAAIDKAKGSVDEFIAKLAKPKVDYYYAIKYPLKNDKGETEHIWVDQLMFADGKFRGRLANEPLAFKGMKAGDRVEVPKDQISDWAMYEGEKAIDGGFTTEVLRKQMGKE